MNYRISECYAWLLFNCVVFISLCVVYSVYNSLLGWCHAKCSFFFVGL